MPEQAEIIPIEPDAGNAAEGKELILCLSFPPDLQFILLVDWQYFDRRLNILIVIPPENNLYYIVKRGALIYRAEIIPIAPEPGNAGEGMRLKGSRPFPGL